ncbi:MAG: hypothetical protein R3253_04490, partial [Longimicrobiales bacterium]|nr:hypothetical protein [Longimicrobiales bacterium]
MTVRGRLLAGFGAVVVLLLIPSLFAVSTLTQLGHLAVERRSGQATAVASLGWIQAMASDIDRLERSLVATSDSALGVAAAAAVDSLVLAYDELTASPYGEAAVTLGPTIAAIQERSAEVEEELRAGRVADATVVFESLIDELAALERQTAQVARTIDAQAQEELARAERLTAAGRRR